MIRQSATTGFAATGPASHAALRPAALQDLRASEFTIVALSPRQPAMTLDELACSRMGDQRLALLVGTESNGLSANPEAQADVRVRIPMQHSVDSIDLSVAAGVTLSWLA